MAFTYDFIPATNKEGFSLGIFQGFDVKEGQSPATDRKTGEPLLDENNAPVMRPWSFVSLLFEVKGRVSGTTKVIRLTTNGKFGTGGDLEETLKRMGWVNKHVQSTVDEDGLEVDSMGEAEEDEDGLGVVADDLSALTQMSFEDFVDTAKGSKFWLKVSKDSKGFYRIESDSIAPKV